VGPEATGAAAGAAATGAGYYSLGPKL